MITQKELKELFKYSPSIGEFTRVVTTGNRSKAGAIAGSLGVSGYLQISINRKIYKAHRLAWLYEYGEMPKGQIDHIDHNRSNNKIVNLRIVCHQDNGKNQKLRRNNKSGFNGVFWHPECSKWMASVKVDGKSKYLGLFNELSDAVLERLNAESEIGYHVNHGNDCIIN